MMLLRRLIHCIAAIMVVMLPTGPAFAYPVKAIEYVIPFSPGGESDITARLQRTFFQQKFGQDLIIDYKPGRGGADGWSTLNQMPPDGYTIMGVNMPHIVLQPAQEGDAGYKTEDLHAVYWFQYTPDVLIVKVDSPFKTLDDLIGFAKKHDGKLTFSGSGSGSANHLAQARFDKLAGINTVYVPFKGSGTSITALFGGQVDAAWGYTSHTASTRERIRVLAVADNQRHPNYPDAPTFAELGFNLVSGAYRGIAVPKGTPDPIKRKLSQLIGEINSDQHFQRAMITEGFVLIDVPFEKSASFMQEKAREYLAAARENGIVK
jgi:tripartite-type tricarboxylate transporter receptor subunit TctC